MKSYLNKIIISTAISVFCLLVFIAQAQNRKQITVPVKEFKGKAYLAGGKISEGKISKSQFDSLIFLPIEIIDTIGKKRKSINYTVTYAERGLFEDSVGRRKIMTEHYSIVAAGGTIPKYWLNSLINRTKHGDTVTINNIEFKFADSINAPIYYASPIKVIIQER